MLACFVPRQEAPAIERSSAPNRATDSRPPFGCPPPTVSRATRIDKD